MLYGFLAVRRNVQLVTSVLVLPQRQAALVAKQAAEVAMLSNTGSASGSESVGTKSNTTPLVFRLVKKVLVSKSRSCS